jgi:DNA-binding response OmpR family regulator
MTVTAKPGRDVLDIGPLLILPDERLARAGGRPLMLSIRELRLLTELARREDRIMAREELFRLGSQPINTLTFVGTQTLIP